MLAGASTSARPRPMLNQPRPRATGAASFWFIARDRRPIWRTTSSARSPASMIRVSVVSLIDTSSSIASASRLHHDFDAAVLLVPEGLVELRALFQAGAVGDHEGGVDLALRDPPHQRRQIALDRGLRHAEGDAAVHRRAHRDLVVIASRYADHRD